MPDRAVVALDICILLGLAGLDLGQGYAPLFCPIDQRPADIFRAIVDPNGQGLTLPLNDPIKSADNTVAHPAAAAALLFGGPTPAPLFAALHGGGSGLLSISRGALPLALFGPKGYGRRQGLVALPSNIATSAAPLIVGLRLDFAGPTAVVLMTTALAIAATLALLALRAPQSPSSASM